MKLSVEGISKTYTSKSKDRSIHALTNVSLGVAEGEILGIVGESGCGKSTLSRIIAGLELPNSGTVKISGVEQEPISNLEFRNRLRPIQLVFQDPYSSLNPRQTIYSAIAEVVAIYDSQLSAQDQRSRTLELLRQVGIGEDLSHRFPHQFSGGQRQRICIARSLAAKPEILLLDEPVSALDVSVRADIINLLLELKSKFQLTYIFVSHDLEIVKHVSDHIVVMYQGKVVEYGTWSEVMNNPKDPYTKALISAIPKLSNFVKKSEESEK